MTMKSLILGITVALCGLALGEQYTDRYDNLNVDEILANRRLFIPYIKCVLEQGRCVPEAKELKKHLIDGIQTACEKCTPWQRKAARKVVKHMKANEKDSWEQVKKKYDPNDEFKPKYEAFLAADD